MTTRANDRVVVEPNGLVRCCAWCLPKPRLEELHRRHPCTDTVCDACSQRLAQELA